MKILLLKIIALCLPILLLVLTINIYVDSGGVIRDRSGAVAEILVSGKNAGIKNIPSQWGRLQVAVVNQQIRQKNPKPKDLLVFGTSRSSELSDEIFIDNTFFNCVVPGGNILDYVALYGLYKKANLLPNHVIISIDPWTFHGRKETMVNKKLYYIGDPSVPLHVSDGMEDALLFGMKDIGIEDTSVYKSNSFKEQTNYAYLFYKAIGLFLPNYFQVSIRSLALPPYFKEVFATEKNGKHYFVIRKDGSYALAEQSEVNGMMVKASAQKFIEAQKEHFFLPGDVRGAYFKYFEGLIQALKKDGVTAIIFFPPIHPLVYDELTKYETNDIEAEIKKFCKNNNIVVMGSFNPHKYGINEADNYFMDEYHPVKSIIRKVVLSHAAELNKIGLHIH